MGTTTHLTDALYSHLCRHLHAPTIHHQQLVEGLHIDVRQNLSQQGLNQVPGDMILLQRSQQGAHTLQDSPPDLG
jgi:hypothetical protein